MSLPQDTVSLPDIEVSVRQTFGLDCDMQCPAFSTTNSYVPDVDEAYRFDRDTTLAILAGFAHNRRVLIQGQGFAEARQPLLTLLVFLAVLLPFSLWVFTRAVRRAKREGSLIQY